MSSSSALPAKPQHKHKSPPHENLFRFRSRPDLQLQEDQRILKKLKRSLKKIKEDWSPDQLTSQSAAALDLQELELSEAARLES
jgi:hypothetical protein